MTKKLGVGLVSVLLAGTVAAFVLSSAAASSRAACKTLVVAKGAASYRHYSTIQAAVDRARPCDWILIAPGVYPEKVVIKTPNPDHDASTQIISDVVTMQSESMARTQQGQPAPQPTMPHPCRGVPANPLCTK